MSRVPENDQGHGRLHQASEVRTVTSVGEDFPRQQERVRKLWGEFCKADDEHYDADAVAHLEGVLSRAADAQSSGDLLQILRSYGELTECRLP